jgi:hypothetical protein
VAEHTRGRTDDTGAEHREGPADQGVGVAARDALVDRPSNQRRRDGLRGHPGRAVDHAEHQGAPLPAGHPEEEARGGAQVGGAGVGLGEIAHRRTTVGAGSDNDDRFSAPPPRPEFDHVS